MNEELRTQLETYHKEDEFEQIVNIIHEIPSDEWDYELVSHLGRALNNLERYGEALDQFLKVAEQGQDDPLWHYRTGLAYYYLGNYDEAQKAFRTADRLEPDDEDTLEFLRWIQEKKDRISQDDVQAHKDQDDSPNPVLPLETTSFELSSSEFVSVRDSGAKALPQDFWEFHEQGEDPYFLAPPSEEQIASIEEELVFKLPNEYIQMMKIHNGGIPRYRHYPVKQSDSSKVVTLSAMLGIGREKEHSLCGRYGSRYQIEKEGYPEFGVVICECADEHQAVMLDYREVGNDGEPEVVHVNMANGQAVTRLAPDFKSFVQGLMKESAAL